MKHRLAGGDPSLAACVPRAEWGALTISRFPEVGSRTPPFHLCQSVFICGEENFRVTAVRQLPYD
jgi:hypothetical protein